MLEIVGNEFSYRNHLELKWNHSNQDFFTATTTVGAAVNGVTFFVSADFVSPEIDCALRGKGKVLSFGELGLGLGFGLGIVVS